MIHFQYHAPTQVIFGQDSYLQTPRLIQEAGASRILVHYGRRSVIRSGLLSRMLSALQDAGIPYETLGGVRPNPRLSLVHEGISLVKEKQIDFILAIGGGSVIDSAKAIAYGACNEGEIWDYYMKRKQVKGALPIGCIATAAAAGSEMSNSSVITNEEGWLKRGLSSSYGYCRFALLDPALTLSMPMEQTMSGCTDILMHALERFFTREAQGELIDEMTYALMRTVIRHTRRLHHDLSDLDSRAQIMWASEAAHNGMCGDRTLGDWASHQLEHELSGMFDVAHGAGLAALWPSWARYVCSSGTARFAALARNLFDIRIPDDEACAYAGIDAMEALFREIGMPVRIHELGITLSDEQIDLLARKCSYDHSRTIGKIKALDEEDMKNIYRQAR